jgi:hypothetical protein
MRVWECDVDSDTSHTKVDTAALRSRQSSPCCSPAGTPRTRPSLTPYGSAPHQSSNSQPTAPNRLAGTPVRPAVPQLF